MKKLISMIMCAVLIISASIPAFADTGDCDCGFSPIIYVGPLGCTSIVRDAGGESEQQLWKIDTQFLLSNLKDVLPDISKALLFRDSGLLGDALVAFVNACFGDLALDSEGRSKPNVTTPELNFPQGDRHGIDSDYYFDYDFRLDPYGHADRLYEFINQVKELTRQRRGGFRTHTPPCPTKKSLGEPRETLKALAGTDDPVASPALTHYVGGACPPSYFLNGASRSSSQPTGRKNPPWSLSRRALVQRTMPGMQKPH